MPSTINIRPVTSDDHDAVLALAPRLLAGIPPWCDPVAWLATTQRFMEETIADDTGKTRALIAEDEQRHLLGYITMTQSKHFTGEAQLYIGHLVVTAEAEGTGVGRALIGAAEQHARSLGLGCIALDTSRQANDHALAFYRRQGFVEESVRLAKLLNE